MVLSYENGAKPVKKAVEFKVELAGDMAFAVHGTFTPVRVLYYTDATGTYRHFLRVGLRDELELFYKKGTVYVLGLNEPLGYASLVAFCGTAELGDVFVDGGKYERLRGRKLNSLDLIKKMIEILEAREE